MKRKQKSKDLQAFTLIELSIVLVIVGLVVGGVLVARDLIRGSEIRSVITDYQKYTTAVFAFREKYAALPGDIGNATTYWGAADGNDGTGADCIDVVTGDARTCNGNADGNLSEKNSTSVECYRAWQHLANAGMVPGKFSGANGAGSSAYNSIIGENIPGSKINNAGFSLHAAYLAGMGSAHHFPQYYSIRFIFGTQTPNTTVFGAVFKPKELYSLDMKMDDGKPGQGRIRGPKLTAADAPNCTTTDDPDTAEYNMNNTNIACALTGQPGF